MTTNLDAVLREALVEPNPRESEKRTKETVAEALERFDPTASVQVTTYFNHTFAPDIILRWGKAERPVFLRFTDNLPALAHDIDLLDRLDPIVFGLTTPPTEDAKKNRVHERSQKAEILFTTPAAVDELTSPTEPAATDRILRNSLAHGGRRALVAPEDAVHLAQQVQSGFAAAASGTVTETRDALAAISDYFHESQARHLNRVLQAVWEGSGARLDQFPGERDLADEFSDLSLRYLLQFMDTSDQAFWHGVGRGLTVEQLIALGQAGLARQENFQHLVNANLEYLHARACLIHDMSLYDSDPEEAIALRWGVDLPAGETPPAVTLRGPQFQAFIARTKELLDPRVREAAAGLPVRAFTERSSTTKVASVEVSAGEQHMTLREDSGVTSREFLEATTSRLAEPQVDRAAVVTDSGRVSVDFLHSTGTGVTRSETLVAHLLRCTVPLLIELNPSSRAALEDFLAVDGILSHGTDELPFDDDTTGDTPDEPPPDPLGPEDTG
ncbi:hypothetical protein [Propionicimonas sp.]|uniref:hypothetical protein n=1 Tax=Propionicimonas sp. TaxID=1955623 RepID=UPI0039E2F057